MVWLDRQVAQKHIAELEHFKIPHKRQFSLQIEPQTSPNLIEDLKRGTSEWTFRYLNCHPNETTFEIQTQNKNSKAAFFKGQRWKFVQFRAVLTFFKGGSIQKLFNLGCFGCFRERSMFSKNIVLRLIHLIHLIHWSTWSIDDFLIHWFILGPDSSINFWFTDSFLVLIHR